MSSLKVDIATYCLFPQCLGLGLPDGSAVKNPPANAGDTSLIPGLGISPGGENGNSLQYSCWENTMDRECDRLYSPWNLKELDMPKCLSISTETGL